MLPVQLAMAEEPHAELVTQHVPIITLDESHVGDVLPGEPLLTSCNAVSS